MPTLPQHLFISDCPGGSLHDTRQVGWAGTPVRAIYRYTYGTIKTTAQLKATLRNGPYAWPGGYPMYFITSDGGSLSFDSVRKELRNVLSAIKDRRNDGWRVVACDINYEDSELICDHSGEWIESAYGEDRSTKS